MLAKIRLKDFLSDTKGFGYHIKTGVKENGLFESDYEALTIIILFTTFP